MECFGKLSFVQFPAGIPGIQYWKFFCNSNLLAAFVDAVPFGNGYSLPLSVKQVLPLKFVNSGYHGEHQLPCRRSCVQLLFVADKMDPLLLQLFYQFQQVFRASGKTAKVMDVYSVPFSHKIQHGFELWTICVLAADLLCEPFLNVMLLQGFDLPCFVLFFRADTHISHSHLIQSFQK